MGNLTRAIATFQRYMALNLLLRHPNNKHSLRVRRKIAAWDDDFLASIISS
ncbi:MAG: hypothetical protein LBI68_03800 [Azoarcus sp.]|nr:hypothetical protein [Azoarcus sp.]